jgi:hypothetical protein
MISTADSHTPKRDHKKEVFVRHALIIALVAALVLIAAPLAFAFPPTSGARADYDNVYTSPANTACVTCHNTSLSQWLDVLPNWADTLHAQTGSVADETVNALPISEGPGCAGCHSGNYDPSKAQGTLETPTPGTTITAFPVIDPTTTPDPGFAYSEPFVGCSACHGSQLASHTQGALDSGLGYSAFANPDICGQCHARYSKTVATYTYTPYPSASPTTIQPQYAVGFEPLGSTLLTDVLNIAQPPTGFWPTGQSARAHGENAVQYDEMFENFYTATPRPIPTDAVVEVTHFNALASLQQTDPQDNFVTASGCLECHSADYQIIQRWNNANPSGNPNGTKTLPTLNQAKYGDACVTCHDPHAKGTTHSIWNPDRNPQLVAPQSQLCTKCHNTEIPADQNGQLAPGEEVHHPQQEIMAGKGAIGVPQTPSVHKGDCVQCHMVPTGYEFDGAPGTGANHLFKIVYPEQAASTTVMVLGQPKTMPYSSCSTCHGTGNDFLAQYLQPVIDARQSLFVQQTADLSAKLDKGAIGIGYVDTEDAALDLGESPDKAANNPSAQAFLKAETNMEFVTQDGSMGIHNWAYTERVIEVANAQADQVKPTAFTITLKASKTSPNAGAKITLSGTVSSSFQSAGKKLTIQKKSGSGWKTIATVTVKAGTANGTYSFKWKVPKGKSTLRSKFGPYTFSGVTRPAGFSKTVVVTGK